MSATTSTSSPAVCIKLELRFSNGKPSVFHRFTQGFTSVEELKSLCFKLWNQEQQASPSAGAQPPRLALRYSDDEGDQVIISTQHEWDECVRIYYENKFNVLRLNVVSDSQKKECSKDTMKKSNHGNDKKAEDLLTSAADEFFSMLFGARPTTSPSRRPATRCQASDSVKSCHPFARFCGPQRPSQCQQPQQRREGCCPAFKRWSCRSDSEVQAAHEKRQKAVSNLLSILFNGDKKEENKENNTLPFGGSCVNLFQLYQDVVASGNHLMDAGCLEEAGRLLASALEVFPSDKLHLYNLACVKSLEGSVEEALKLLLEAKKHGYNNLAHAAVDPDLENLRQSADFATKFFMEFLGQQPKNESSRPQDTTTAEKENIASEDDEEEAKSVKTVNSSHSSSSGASTTTTNGNPDAVALVNMFPNLSFAEAEKALERFGGDLSAAVNLLLE